MSKLMGRMVGSTRTNEPATARRSLAALTALALLAATTTIAAAQGPATELDDFGTQLHTDEVTDKDLEIVPIDEAEYAAGLDEALAPSMDRLSNTEDSAPDAAFDHDEDVVFGANDRVWVDKGCGSTYALGDPIRIYMQVDQSGYYYLRLSSSAGARTYRVGLPAGRAVYLTGTIGQPTGQRDLRLSGANTNVTCSFQVGTSAAPPRADTRPDSAPLSGGLRITKLHAADDLLRPAPCLSPGGRTYFVAEVHNADTQARMATVSILTKGNTSSWWLERMETFDLAPGERRQVLAYVEGYRAADYGLKAMVHHAGAEQDHRSTSFKIGSCP